MVEGGGVKGSVDSLDVEPTIMPALPRRWSETDTLSPHNPFTGNFSEGEKCGLNSISYFYLCSKSMFSNG
jgi:hypothetical protein